MRKFLTYALILILALAFWRQFFYTKESSTIRIGVLHSLTGTMSISERSMVDAVTLAVEEINASGGLLDRKVEMVIADGRSDWPTFAREAERLILEENVSTIFGCWTSSSRKAVKRIVEKHNHLLIYPLQYEGLEESSNIVYTGAAPNQQIIPAVKWCMNHLGKKFFLVGSDYVFPRTANAIIRDQVTGFNGTIVGEEYILLGSRDVSAAVQKIVETKPDVILNTINGDSNVAFFHELRKAGVLASQTPTMSFSIAEEEIRNLTIPEIEGDYASWNYFQSISDEENRNFISRFRARFGSQRVTDDPIETAYFSVFLWAQSVQENESHRVNDIRNGMANQSFRAPGGIVYVDATTHHTWKPVRIGKINGRGQFDIVWSSEYAIRPIPFPAYRNQLEWETFLQTLYNGWGQKWENTEGTH